MKIGSLIAGLGVAFVLAGGPVQAGPDGTLGMALMSATVDLDGTVAAGSGLASTANVRNSSGDYIIPFDRKLTGCSCTASFGTHDSLLGGYDSPTNITANCPASPDSNVARVFTRINGGLSDSWFHLIVFCPK